MNCSRISTPIGGSMIQGRPYQFALVTHSTEVVEAVRKHIDPENESLAAELVDLDKALPTAKRLLEKGYEVILGHGGTGAIIAQNLGQQVVNIPTTMFEVLNAVMEAKEISDRIAITSFASPRDEIGLIEKLLGLTIRQIIYRTNSELQQGVHAALKGEFRVIVGGGVSRSLVSDSQGTVILIEPNPKLIRQALNQARAIAASRRREVESSEQFKTILQVIGHGLVGIDNFGRLNFFNPAAEEILKVDLKVVMGQSLSRVSRDLGLIDVLAGGKLQIDEIRKVSGKDLVVNSLPIHIDGRVRGAVALFREAHAIHNIDRKLKERLHLKGFVARYTEHDIKGESAKIIQLLLKARKYAQADATILIQGETGTGKEVLANSIHHLSQRRDKPFVAFNCSAIPENLTETELFGYEEGAFTGAKKGGKIGLFELANQGTIFLDEIADITTAMQVRLLRVLETKEVMRVGGDRILPVDVRVIASAHRDLRQDVAAGRFRPDLYFRLSVLRLTIPSLRERAEDILIIADEVLRRHGADIGCLSSGIQEMLLSYDWPGNIRELMSVLESYLILVGKNGCDERLFGQLMTEIRWEDENTGISTSKGPTGAVPLKQHLETYEKNLVARTLKECRYNRKLAAEALGVSTSTLWRKLTKDH